MVPGTPPPGARDRLIHGVAASPRLRSSHRATPTCGHRAHAEDLQPVQAGTVLRSASRTTSVTRYADRTPTGIIHSWSVLYRPTSLARGVRGDLAKTLGKRVLRAD